jgi:putative transposase
MAWQSLYQRAETVESRMQRELHVRFGGRAEETHRPKDGRALRSDPYTYIPTWNGFLYLGVILDVFTRMIVGWSMSNSLGAEIVVDALQMAVHRRKPDLDAVHHSDQGSQYAAMLFGRLLRDHGLVASMESVGDCFDNAMAESFFATLETELLDRTTFRNHNEARIAIFDYIETFYNKTRRHSGIGHLSPIEFERRWMLEQIQAD